MLVELDAATFHKFFPVDPHPYISEPFVELNKAKADVIIRLADVSDKPSVGIIAGVKDGILRSPFSAPFGGFHFRKEILHIGELDDFLSTLKDYIISKNYKGIELILPPDIYHATFNAKTVNSLVRNEFQYHTPDLTSWIDLHNFNGAFTQKNSKEYYRQALRNDLLFEQVSDEKEERQIFEVIRENRARFGRPIYMTFEDILNTGKLWPVDFFKVESPENKIVASAIFYRCHPDICYAVFWGDTEEGRPLRAMDFLAFNLWSLYKEAGFRYLDFGTSTDSGIPNEGLLRFKESHEAITSLRYKFYWNSSK